MKSLPGRIVHGAFGVLFLVSSAVADNGIISIRSAHDVASTTDRLAKVLAGKGMTVFARIDHAAGAHGTGQELRPTELLIFGNPRVGTPLMQCSQTAAIDLPQKALIREDEQQQVWLSYNDPQYLARRHGIKGCEAVLEKIARALDSFARAATAPDQSQE